MSAQPAPTSTFDPVPAVTDHAADRWDLRTRPESISPEAAWVEAYEMRLPTPQYRHVDEARYWRPDEVVLIRQDAVIPTVLDAFGPDARTIVSEAVRNQFYGGGRP